MPTSADKDGFSAAIE
jgi:hypothetical protein